MAAKSFLRLDTLTGLYRQVFGTQTSVGAAAGDIVSLNDQAQLDRSLFPTGIGADTNDITATEALAAGDFVNVYDSGSGTFACRKADASTVGKEAHGFVLANVNANGTATVYGEGSNNALTSLSPGNSFLSATTPGKATKTPPTGSGQIVQPLGYAVSATTINVEIDRPTVLA